jgi:hypothetical protein
MDGKNLWLRVAQSVPPFGLCVAKNTLGKKCNDYKEASPQMIETNDSVDFYWDPV